MAKFYYNGVLLPELPNPADYSSSLIDYKYFNIVKQVSKTDESFNHILYVSAGEWMYVDYEGGMIGTNGDIPSLSNVVLIYNLVDNEWVLNTEYAPEVPFAYFISSEDEYYNEPVWFSHDVPTMTPEGEPTGEIYMTASEPIPEDEYNPGGGDVIFDGDVELVNSMHVFETGSPIETGNEELCVVFNNEEHHVKPVLTNMDGAEAYCAGNKHMYIDYMINATGFTYERLLSLNPNIATFNEDTGENFLIICPKNEDGTLSETWNIMAVLPDGTYPLKISKLTGSNTGGDILFDGDVTTVLNGDTDGSTCYIHSTTAFKDLADGDCLDVIYDGSKYTVSVKTVEDAQLGTTTYVGNMNVYGTQAFEAQFSQYFANIEEFLEQNPSFAWLFVDTGEPFMIQMTDEAIKFITEEPGTYHFTIKRGSGSSSGGGEDSDIPQVILPKTLLTNIADAIREKTGKTDKMYLSQMPEEIEGIVGKSLLADVIEGEEEIALSSDLVTDVGQYAFYFHPKVTSVDFPNCETIGKYAFHQCSKLTTANFSNCVTVGQYAFANCSKLSEINFPVCETISGNAFSYCSLLTEVNFPVCTTIGGSAFACCYKLTTANFQYCTAIGIGAFRNCSRLTSVSFPACETIGSSAFYSCYSLTEVNFPACKTISDNAFNNCSRLTEVNFPACTTIGSYAFRMISTLSSISFPTCEIINTNAFEGCSALTTVDFPSCKAIYANYAFGGCIELTTVNLPVCSSIGSYAFNACTGLTNVTFPACTYIGSMAFRSCTALSAVNLPVCISITNNVFVNCTSLISLTLGASSVASLANANAFASTPMSVSTLTGTFGSIYVPASLVDSYKTATNWSVYADRITAITE